jgi:isoleucyl-tRNA synthetase
VPGWDCHGLPIEFKVSQEMRKAGNTSADAVTIRRACDAYARKFIGLMRTQFERVGVLGDWDHPYQTLDKEYEADELRLFADIVEKGFVYRGKKPVYWSIPCRTALAEAEVEYHDHVSQSVYVKFPVIGHPDTSIVIWTTTPWTLPANLAVAYNSTFSYSLVRANGEAYIVSTMLLPTVAQKCGWDAYEIVRSLDALQLEQIEYQHPFCPRTGKLFAGDNFVENSTGTGFVHIAPGHGLEDYGLGRQNGLPIYSPVDDDGCFAYTNDLPQAQQMPVEMIGKSILEKHGKSDANEAVLHELRVRKALLHQENYHHSYPHCWRSKTPVIFRAMDQWFIKIDLECGDLPLPLPVRNERGEGRGEGHPTADTPTHLHARVPSSPQPSPPSAGGEGEEPSALNTCKSPHSKVTFRDQALDAIHGVQWIPDWGKSRIEAAVKSRPDWCISRQRTWGVPIPAFYDAEGNAILDARIVRAAAELIEKQGSNVWFEKSAAELWPLVKPKDWRGPEAATKSNDTLDVWIDSGSSSRSVTARRPELHSRPQIPDSRPKFQVDMYLEGSDQHRGWFQSSLLLSLAGNGAAPYRTVLTHGFMVDADREKISKSKQGQGVYEKPQTAEAYVKKYGADVVRLWVASQDFRNDIVVSEERVNKVGETYRVIRNALRYQLSNLYDFDPAKHTVPDDKLTGLDRWILGAFSKLETEVMAAYDAYEFHVVYQKVSQFAAVELSAIYHDVVKDRLYTDAANSPRRRSTQTALHRLVTGLCQMLAPILSFTADEAWEFVPGEHSTSVHQGVWKQSDFSLHDSEVKRWVSLFQLRESLLPKLEQKRKEKIIGKSLDAKVRLLTASPGDVSSVAKDKDLLDSFRELVNVSQIEPTENRSEELVVHADGQKCERCWHWETDVGSNAEHPTICARCVTAVKECSAKS